tara:strand:+ start:182 stop:619 length:438 start_codon:yes stop_codon:yes gene_type:complete
MRQSRSLGEVSIQFWGRAARLAFEDSFSDLSSIANIFQEEGVLSDTGGLECLTVTADSNDKLVIIQLEHLPLLFDSERLVGLSNTRCFISFPRYMQWTSCSYLFDLDFLLAEIDIIRPALKELNTLTSSSDRLKGSAKLKGSNSC